MGRELRVRLSADLTAIPSRSAANRLRTITSIGVRVSVIDTLPTGWSSRHWSASRKTEHEFCPTKENNEKSDTDDVIIDLALCSGPTSN
jgi:hypothetical protein